MDKKYAAQEAITHSMMGSLGLKLIEEKEGFMYKIRRSNGTVNDNTSQPFGVLCGGASLAFAEIIAGYGSYLCCPEGFIPVGSSVSGNHVSSVRKAPDVLVYAEATALHLGRTTHLWNVDIKTENGRLVSTVRVTNFIVKDKSESWK